MNANKILVWKSAGMRSVGRERGRGRREENIKTDLGKQDVRMELGTECVQWVLSYEY